MSKPDNDIIAEVSLYAEGFKDAKIVGQKLVNIFTLASKLLTTQQHYDWGLRALKTVLKGNTFFFMYLFYINACKYLIKSRFYVLNFTSDR